MKDEQTRVGVIGLGYVGLPLALAMHDAGYDVVGVDIDADKIDRLRNGQSTVNDVTDEEVRAATNNGITFTTDYDLLSDADGVSICVPTPLRKTDTPDLSFVLDAAERLAPVVTDGCTVVLESTVYPGATEDALADVLAENGAVVGEDLYLAFSPERIDPGNEEYGPTDIPKVLGGVTEECGDRAEALYDPVFDEVVRVDSATEAELVKLLENTFRAVNIGLINELAQIAHELDVDIWDAIDAAETKPFGFMPFYPGPGLGGHCIPIDPFYLSWKADEHDVDTRFINLADTVNREMPQHVVQRVVRQLNDRGTALSNANILVVGAAYKPDVSDTRESPAIDIITELDGWGAVVDYHDPYVPELEVEDATYESVSLTDERLHTADCVILVTDHSTLDIDRLVDETSLIFDTRNATSSHRADHVVRL
ncbi:nucleotide sugar dehydrogenase [Halorubrum ezzemoulense]|uniref:UDP-N-acetyl-D-mannosamine dehydrogenase n=1 Tax=Halorubrum ezzemoulense TaxID=337243 RepID=A0ABT4Z466_HALEZ|nr:nucleotide sugar dehydrogenase [Halorubrum ezzemoulense]MDB2245712.1 nucleotide sugar dehydrogenase [Halorubrum ezzemoulense]MDB2279359.1 nucleotide sugar dehydrogenase [Halorubrum ezzemoulense]MDB2289871.1 nucleotide sugar dehydrogenase [Halorubrum ezzemoulense]MDB2292955.1 nucleotide sugar dehydrogenase [Halorubrum ezzemoulense]MDB2297341.1 nucleotide sugar dehydrogenase [Halorubrum ezzemoulense]